jgi:hypothetical protein
MNMDSLTLIFDNAVMKVISSGRSFDSSQLKINFPYNFTL